MKTSMILARDIAGVIGVDNKLPWNVPADLALFKRVTQDKIIAMGRKTWESLPVKPLPGRINIVITSDTTKIEGVDAVVNSVEKAIITASTYSLYSDELIFIGGRSIYEQVVNFVDEIHLSELNLFADVQDINSPNVALYHQDFDELGFVLLSYEEIFDDSGMSIVDYHRYVRPLVR